MKENENEKERENLINNIIESAKVCNDLELLYLIQSLLQSNEDLPYQAH